MGVDDKRFSVLPHLVLLHNKIEVVRHLGSLPGGNFDFILGTPAALSDLGNLEINRCYLGNHP